MKFFTAIVAGLTAVAQSALIPFQKKSLNIPATIKSPVPCDGRDFKCNTTNTRFSVTAVDVESASGVHWKPEDRVIVKMQGHINGFDVEAGTLHYQIWELGMVHFEQQNATDYFVCGPPPKPCDKSKPLALKLADPTSLNSAFELSIEFMMPSKQASGNMTIDLWGEDQDHEPYDFTASIQLQYTE